MFDDITRSQASIPVWSRLAVRRSGDGVVSLVVPPVHWWDQIWAPITLVVLFAIAGAVVVLRVPWANPGAALLVGAVGVLVFVVALAIAVWRHSRSARVVGIIEQARGRARLTVAGAVRAEGQIEAVLAVRFRWLNRQRWYAARYEVLCLVFGEGGERIELCALELDPAYFASFRRPGRLLARRCGAPFRRENLGTIEADTPTDALGVARDRAGLV